MRKIICQVILFLSITLLLNGCVGTTAETRYYALNSSAIAENTNAGTIISVGPFEIPEYLNRHNVVIRGQGTNLQVLKFDRWAEPLADAVTRRIVITLSGKINDGFVVQFPASTDISPDYRVRGRITHFEADQQGEVRLSVRWGILDREHNFVATPRGANFSTSVEPSDDVAAITTAMGDLLDELTLSIEKELNAVGLN
jgi:uncharacterized lipoprotein YmbA